MPNLLVERILNSWNCLTIVIAATSFLFLSGIAEAKVIIKEKTVYYSIKGKDGAALNRHMITKGPRKTKLSHAIAATQTNLKFGKAKVAVRGKNCVVDDVDVFLTLKYTLPKWSGRKTASKALGKAWDDFYKKLVSHEKKHGKIAKDAAYAFEKEIKRLKGNISKKCSDFGRFAEFRFLNISSSLSRRQMLFDRQERFGFSGIARSQKTLFQTK